MRPDVEFEVTLGSHVEGRGADFPGPLGDLPKVHYLNFVIRGNWSMGYKPGDLLQVHDRDALTPLDETLRAFDDLVTHGKIRHIGVCNFSASELERARDHLCTRRGSWWSGIGDSECV